MTLSVALSLAATGIGLWLWIIGTLCLFCGRLFNRNFASNVKYTGLFLVFLIPLVFLAISAYLSKVS